MTSYRYRWEVTFVLTALWINSMAPRAKALEASLEHPTKIDFQGIYGYCVYYAMANFFELWANQVNGKKTPALSAAFLAMTNNFEWNAGQEQYLGWAWVSAAKNGVIPMGATDVERNLVWPGPDWEVDQLQLQSLPDLHQRLTGKYVHPHITNKFTGSSYLKHVVKIDMTDVRFLTTNHFELTPRGEGNVAKTYRYGSFEATQDRYLRVAKHMGIDVEFKIVDPEVLYEAIKIQIYQKRPALVTIMPGITKMPLDSHDIVGRSSLVLPGEAKPGHHLLTAVGHCDNWQSEDPLCQQFAARMEEKGMRECLVFENSWGLWAHKNGYLCISKIASRRILREAAVMSGSLAGAVNLVNSRQQY